MVFFLTKCHILRPGRLVLIVKPPWLKTSSSMASESICRSLGRGTELMKLGFKGEPSDWCPDLMDGSIRVPIQGPPPSEDVVYTAHKGGGTKPARYESVGPSADVLGPGRLSSDGMDLCKHLHQVDEPCGSQLYCFLICTAVRTLLSHLCVMTASTRPDTQRQMCCYTVMYTDTRCACLDHVHLLNSCWLIVFPSVV